MFDISYWTVNCQTLNLRSQLTLTHKMDNFNVILYCSESVGQGKEAGVEERMEVASRYVPFG